MKKLIISLILIAPLSATTYFVDTSGNDSNAGTSSGAAWQHLSKVQSSSFSGDDIIQLKKGQTWAEQLTFPSSGSSGHQITITSYGSGSQPIIDCAATRAHAIITSSKSYITIDGIQGQNCTSDIFSFTTSTGVIIQNSTAKNTRVAHGIAFYGANASAQVISNTVIDDAGQPIGGTGITCQPSLGSNCDGIIIDGNTVTRFGDVRKSGIILYDSNSAVIRNNTVTLNDLGIQLHTATATVTAGLIYNNQILDTKLYASGDGEGMEITGCRGSGLSVCKDVSSGTYTSGGSAAGTGTCTLTSFNNGSSATATVAVSGGVITGGSALTITSAGYGATSAPTSATLGNGGGTGVCSGTAVISTVLATHRITASIYNNLWKNANTTTASDFIGAVIQANILVYNNIGIGPATYGVHASSDCSGGTYYGNTFYNISNTGILIDDSSGFGCANNTLKNNIIHTAVSHSVFATATASNTVEDYNDLYNSGSKSGFTVGSGANDITTNPQFTVSVPTSAADVRLLATSPNVATGLSGLGSPYLTGALDPRGTSFPYSTINQDSVGVSWTRGAFTYVPPEPTPVAAGPATGKGGTIVVYETDNTAQNTRPITIGRPFKQGEFTACLQPVVSGFIVQNYQVDVKSRWPADSSVKFAVVSFAAPVLASGSNMSVTFQAAASCNNGGYLTQTQMGNFNSGGGGTGWGADVQVTANGTTVTTDAKTMLAAGNPGSATFNDCAVDYYLQGPVVTQVLVQDCTATFSKDFGWLFTNVATPAMSTACAAGSIGSTCSIHPWFLVSFYPGQHYNISTNTCNADDYTCAVKVDFVLENDYPGRAQDQVLTNVVWRTGGTPTAQLTRNCGRVLSDVGTTASNTTITSASAAWSAADVGCPIYLTATITSNQSLATVIKSVTDPTHAVVIEAPALTKSNVVTYVNDLYSMTRWRKSFWSGTAPGHILINQSWTYLVSTKAFPYYDMNVSVSPVSTDFPSFMTGDRGDLGGGGVADGPNSTWGLNTTVRQFSANNEGALMQREDLLYLYNMTDCGTVSGKCAKAWYMLTGEYGARDASMVSSQPYTILGGGGQWNTWGNVPFHFRENRTTTRAFYCPNYETTALCTQCGINAVPATLCGATTPSSVGKVASRHGHPTSQYTGASGGGMPDSIAVVGKRTLGGWDISDCSHWLNYSYTPALLTGDFYYMEEQFMGASFCLGTIATNQGGGESNLFYGYINPSPLQSRWYAWGMQEIARSAWLAPDGTSEKSYYTNMFKSNLEIQEGVMNKMSSLTPTQADASGHATNLNCDSYDYKTANRWNWGYCTVQSMCYVTGTPGGASCTSAGAPPIPVKLHMFSTGQCTTSAGDPSPGYLDITKTSSANAPYWTWWIGMALSHAVELGYSEASTLAGEAYKRLVEQLNNGNLDSNGNPYLVAVYNDGTKNGAPSATNNCLYPVVGPPTPTVQQAVNKLQYFTTWPQWRSALLNSALQNVNKFDHGATTDPPWVNAQCGDHGYSLLARGLGTYVGSTNSTDQTCTGGGGTCTGSAAQAWIMANAPYFSNTPADGRSTGCGTSDAQIKFAIAPRPAAGATCTITTGSPLPTGTVNVLYSAPLATSDCIAPISFALTGGSLPVGITLNSSTGVISGTTANAGVYNFTVVATDSVPTVSPSAPYALTMNGGTATGVDISGQVTITGQITIKP